MTCGIYSIYLNEYNRYYIGHSTSIEIRKSNHLSMLRNNRHYNYKLQNAYNKTNIFELELIEECCKEYLHSREDYYIKEFDAIDLGYNISSAGISGKGIEHGSSKYSKEQIVDAFLYAVDPTITYKDISIATGIPTCTVRHIAGRETHFWLDELFPIESQILYNLKNTHARGSAIRRTHTYKFNCMKSPDNEVFLVTNISQFGREHNLDSNKVGEVLRGTRNTHKGWVGYNNNISRLES